MLHSPAYVASLSFTPIYAYEFLHTQGLTHRSPWLLGSIQRDSEKQGDKVATITTNAGLSTKIAYTRLHGDGDDSCSTLIIFTR